MYAHTYCIYITSKYIHTYNYTNIHIHTYTLFFYRDLPECLDLLRNLINLQSLDIHNNQLKTLSDSFTLLKKLKHLNAIDNRIHSLPGKMGYLLVLKELCLNGNELKTIPISLLDCKSLEILNIQRNAVVKLPDEIGLMPQLVKLDVSWNNLSSVPLSLGFSKSLKELLVNENPLVSPPMGECVKGMCVYNLCMCCVFFCGSGGGSAMSE